MSIGKDRGKRWENHVAQFFGGIRKWAGRHVNDERETPGV